ncbi:MAG: choice-of-anchor D domain-containing protein, partial [Calditrichaeota bacterium]|nr:choice-of-anchor D domain-containing protein [Calditrichota bacterium]
MRNVGDLSPSVRLLLAALIVIISGTGLWAADRNVNLGSVPTRDPDEPALTVDPQSIEDDLFTGQTAEHVVNIANDGRERVTFRTEFEIVGEPGRDGRIRRALRNIGAGPMNAPVYFGPRTTDAVRPNNDANSANFSPRRMPVGPRRDDLEDLYVLLILDGDGWSPSNEPVARDLQVRYERIGSRQIREVDFRDFTTVITGDEQGDEYFQIMRDNLALFEDYVSGGGTLVYQAASNAEVRSLIPGGIEDDHAGTDEFNVIVDGADRENPLLAGDPDDREDDLRDRLWGSSVNHWAFPRRALEQNGDIDDLQIFYVVEGQEDRVTLCTYSYGRGNVCATTFTVSAAWGWWAPDENGGSAHWFCRNQYLWAAWIGSAGWVFCEPTEGVINGGSDLDIVVTLNAAGLIEGDWEADLHILSDDEDTPDVVVGIILHVTGAPDIEVEWAERAGYPNLIDWNAFFPDVFVTAELPIPVTVTNTGTADLVVREIAAGHEYFTAAPARLELAPGEEAQVNIIFAPQEGGEINTTVTFLNNSETDPELEIALHGEAFLPPALIVDPQAIEDELNTGETNDWVVNLANEGDALLRWDSDFTVIGEPGDDANARGLRSVRGGPHRDEVDLEGMMFAVFQSDQIWAWLYDGMIQDPLLDENNFHNYRNPNDWNNVNFEDYDVICVSSYEQQFNQQYQQNLERFEEYVDGGGAAYFETGNANPQIRSPGGIYNDIDGGDGNGVLIVSPDQNAENYSLFAEICHESQPNFWNEGELIEGSSWLHSTYSHDQFIRGVENGTLEWFQPIASTQRDRNNWGAVAYGFGSGTVLTVGHPSAHCWFWWNQEGMWGSIAAEILYYLTEAGGGGWVVWDPREGEIPAGNDIDVMVTLDAAGLLDGQYEGELHILSNDPQNQDVAIAISLFVHGAPDIELAWEIGQDNNLIDWNEYHLDLFTTGRYPVPVTIHNGGTAVLNISDISCDNDFFFAEPAELALEPRERTVVNFFIQAEEDGEHQGVMTITSDDPDEEVVEINVIGRTAAPPIIQVEPVSIQDELNTGDLAEHIVNIANNGESLLRFKIDHEIISEPGRDRDSRALRSVGENSGPRRDDLGEIVGRFSWQGAGGQSYKGGIAYDWDNELLFLTGYNNNNFAIVDPNDNYRVVRQWQGQGQGNPMDAAWLDGVFYDIQLWNNGLFRWDVEGRNLGMLNTGGNQPTAVAASQDLGLLLVQNNAGGREIQVMTPEGQVVGTINNYQQFINNQDCRNMLWMDKHPDGQLWCGTQNHIWQVAVDVNNWRAIERVADINVPDAINPQVWDGIGHDRDNLIIGTWGRADYILVDDNVQEAYWLTYDPREGEIAGGNDLDVIVTLNAAGLFDGDYIASLFISSNAPNEPVVEVAVELAIHGAPDIELEWAMGQNNNLIDWNAYHRDLFTGGRYPVPVTIANVGTRVLNVREISSDNDFFVPEPNAMEIPVREEAVCNVFLASNEDGRHEGTLTILSDDPDEGELTINLVGITTAPPIIQVDPQSIQDELNTGQIAEHTFNIANVGDAMLYWTIEAEIIAEPGDDNNGRALRSVNGGPQRDPAGELIAQFQGPNVAGQYCSPVGYDMENDAMFFNGYSASFTAVWTHDNYQNFRELRRWAMPNPMDGAWYNGVLYANQHGQMFLHRWDIEGRNLGNANAGFQFYGVAIDKDNGWIMFRQQVAPNYDIIVHQIMPDGQVGQRLGAISNYLQFLGNNIPYNLEWVSKHPDGELWISNSATQQLVQIDVDTDNWRALREVQRFSNGGAAQPYDACTHDGHNMWTAGLNQGNVRIYDDGVTEMYWLMYDPEEGEVRPGTDIDVLVTLNAVGLIDGEYIAELHILSNDPDDGDVVVNVELIAHGAPDIELEWALGQDDNLIDFNAYHRDLFTGGRYAAPITIANTGTLELTVEGIDTDNQFFWAEPNQFIVEVGEEQVVQVFIQAEEDGRHRTTLTINSDDPDEGRIEIALVGETGAPPVIEVNPNSIEDDLVTGEVAEHIVNIANTGGAPLYFDTDIEVISEPDDRDANARGLRNVRNGPRRDPVDLEGMMFACFQTNSVWGWLDDGMRQRSNGRLTNQNFISYRNAADWNRVEFEDYDAIVVAGRDNMWSQEYANNFARFEDYVA